MWWKFRPKPASTFLENAPLDPSGSGYEGALPLSCVMHWPEYHEMEDGDAVITIEYCHNCELHSLTTRHDPDVYYDVMYNCYHDLIYVLQHFRYSDMPSYK